jgi:isopropylmalate/homocitrate/citramalate synthase
MIPTNAPDRVRIVEVGPRDGLQNEQEAIRTERKLAFVRALVEAGLVEIEATSFVAPQAVPQLADADELIKQLPRHDGVRFSALVPNERGLARAIESGVDRIAVFTAASETFTQKNIRMTIDESLRVFERVVGGARDAGLSVRGYVSTCFVCPYEGDVAREKVAEVAQRLFDLGVDEVSISDTIGAAAPTDIFTTVGHVVERLGAARLALHLHDTYGTALANVCAGLQLGIVTFDSSAGGLGGCPFAPGAAGNLATEDLVYMLDRMGVETGVDLRKVVEAASVIQNQLGRPLASKQWRRLQFPRDCDAE